MNFQPLTLVGLGEAVKIELISAKIANQRMTTSKILKNERITSAKDREESDDDEDAGEDQPWESVAGSVPGLLSL